MVVVVIAAATIRFPLMKITKSVRVTIEEQSEHKRKKSKISQIKAVLHCQIGLKCIFVCYINKIL